MSKSKDSVYSTFNPASCTTYNLGWAPRVVVKKFQEFCSKFTKWTDVVNSLLEMDKTLMSKYRFLPLPDDTPIRIQSTTMDDRQELSEAMIKLHEYANKGKYKSVSTAIEELLMSSPRLNDPSVVDANNSSENTVDSRGVYKKKLKNINMLEKNKSPIQYSSVVPQNSGEHQMSMTNSRYALPVRSIQQNKLGNKLINYSPDLVPVLITGHMENNKVLKRSAVQSSQDFQCKAKVQNPEFTVDQPKESKFMKKKRYKHVETIKFLDEEGS